MAGLSVIFKAVDEISAKLDAISNAGTKALDAFDSIGDIADQALSRVTEESQQAADAMDRAAEATDYWTDKIGNYDKSALEAVYSTDELVEMGLKSADALKEQKQMLDLCEQSAAYLGKAIEATSDIQENLTNAMDEASEAVEKLADNEGVSAETKEELRKASEEAAAAMEKLRQAHEAADQAMQNYDAVMASGTTDLSELEATAEQAESAAESLAEANGRASDATEELSKATEKATKEAGGAQKAIIGLNDVLVAAGIAKVLKEIADAFIECSKVAAGFETNVAMVSTVADTAVLSSEELSAQISALSISTAKGVNELADATYNAISAGVATENAVETVGEATKLATAGFTTSSSALSVLTTAMNAYGLEASEISNISDSLVMSQNLGVLTIDQMASSMGKAISTASAYSVDLYNLESGYISLTKAGISVEESTTYISSMFNELGDSGSEVASIITEQTGKSFGQLMNDGYSLADVLGIVYEAAGQDGEAMMNLWGSAEAGKAANAVINQGLDTFNSNLNKLINSAGTTQAAYEAMTDTTTYSTERMENSFANLSIAIGDDLNPVVSAFKNGIADVTDGFTDLVTEYPAISAILTGAAVGLGAVVAAVTAYITATKIATAVSAAFGTTMTASLGPIGLAVGAIGAVTAAVVYFSDTADAAAEEYDSLTYASKEMKDELDTLSEEYERACDAQGEMSDEALRLRYQIDDLSESFIQNKQTMEDFLSECDEVIDSCSQMADEYYDSMNSLHSNEIGTQALIQRLEDLAASTDNTAGKQYEMEAIINELNASVDGLNLSYGDLISNQEGAVASLEAYLEAQAKQEQMQAQADAYVESIKEKENAEKQLLEVESELADAQEAYSKANKEYIDYVGQVTKDDISGFASLSVSFSPYAKALDAAAEDVDALTAKEEELNAAISEQQKIQQECKEAWGEMANAAEDAAAASDGYAEAKSVLEDYSEAIQQLCEDYDAAYEAALDSIQGQYNLWDEAGQVSAMSSKSIETALQSQLDYWNSYNDNMDALTEKAGEVEGLGDMLANLADGSEESAAMLQGLAKMDDADLSAVVKQYQDLQEAQDETATSMAELETDFSEKMGEIQTDMETMVDSMNMSDDAKSNAKSTMDAYVSEIEAGVARAQSAIDSLSFANDKLSGGGYHGYAEGTIDAEPGLALVGEEGPELVNFGGGEVVYTAGETADILSRGTQGNDFYVAPEEEGEETGTGDKTITLRIEGAGEMRVGGGVNKEDIVNVLMDNVKGALMNIIQQEIMEEGDLAYEF